MELDLDGEAVAGLTSNERLRFGTRRTTRPTFARFNPWLVPLVIKSHYDANNNRTSLEQVVSPTETHTYVFQHDNLDRLWNEKGPSVAGTPTESTYAFDLVGQLIESREKVGTLIPGVHERVTNIAYDDLGRVYKTTGPAPNPGEPRPTSYNYYNAAGDLRYTRDPSGREVERSFDNLHRVTQVTIPVDPLGVDPADPNAPTEAVTTHQYYPGGAIDEIITAAGVTTKFTYDDEGRKKTEKVGNNPSTSYDYDSSGNLTTITDPAGNTVTFNYDALNRQVEEISSGTRTTLYDTFGNVDSTTDRLGRVIDYDRAGRRTSETWVGDQNGYVATFTHDSLGRLQTAVDAESDYDFRLQTGLDSRSK